MEGEGGEEDKRALEILVRKIPEDQQVYTRVLKTNLVMLILHSVSGAYKPNFSLEALWHSG